MWNFISRFILRNRIVFMIAIVAITTFMTYQATRVQMSYEYARMLPETDPTFQEYLKFKNNFGEEANIFVVGFCDSSFFELNKFESWRDLLKEIQKTDGVTDVFSIANIYNLTKDQEQKKFKATPVFPSAIYTQQQLDSLVKIAFSLPIYSGLLYNDTSKVYLLTVTLSRDILDSHKRIEVVESIKEKIDDYGHKFNIDIHYSGMPYIRTAMMVKIKAELIFFIVLSALICAVIMFLFFRSYKVVLFSLLIVGIGVVWSIGLIPLFGYKITILIGVIPPLLIVIGIENSIFLLNKFHSEYRKHGNKIKALQRVIHKTGKAIFFTNFTTGCGFATFLFTDNELLKEFGWIASLSVIGMLIIAVLMVPIIFSFLPPPDTRHVKHLDYKYVGKAIDLISNLSFTKRRWIYYSTIAIVIAGFVGIAFMKTTGYIVDDLQKDDPIYLDLKFFEKHFHGVMPFEIIIDTKKPNGVLRLNNLKKIDELQKRLSKYQEFSKPLSISEASKFARQAFYNGNTQQYKLPDEMNQAFIMSYIKKVENDKNITKAFVDSSKQITRITIQVADVGTKKMLQLQNDVQQELNAVFPPEKYYTMITGNSIVYCKGTSFLIHNMAGSVLLAILVIAGTMASLFSSFRMVLISLIPNLIPLLLTAALMGYFGIPIKPSTIIVFSIAFGISVDNTIHFLSRYRQELDHYDWDISKAAKTAIKEAGTSMIYTSVVLFFGFGILVFSSFGGTQALGLLIAITLLFAMFANLLLLPCMLLSLEKATITDAFKEPLVDIAEEEDDEISTEDLNGPNK